MTTRAESEKMRRLDVWLNIPQAVVLEATGDLERAKGLHDNDPRLLVFKATLLLAPRVFVPLAADATDAERHLAHRKGREMMTSQPSPDGSYQSTLPRVHAKVVAGVTTKGSRAMNLPLEIIDPAEFARLELFGTDAVDPRTGGMIWRDLLVSARELIEANTVEARTCEGLPIERRWDWIGDPHPKLVDWAREQWGDALARMPGRDGLLRLHRQQFGRVYGISEKSMRDLRRALAPESARRGGAPAHRH